MTTYYRYEIALRYFPESSPDSALRRLTNWIMNNKQLYQTLQETGYKRKGKNFTRAQILLIYEYLGEP